MGDASQGGAASHDTVLTNPQPAATARQQQQRQFPPVVGRFVSKLIPAFVAIDLGKVNVMEPPSRRGQEVRGSNNPIPHFLFLVIYTNHSCLV